ncbi:TonB-dependent receptor [Henriciella sp.]|uniref:TonB-dependent receptor n=1 Tax=Henriciella sp. TaxID=1968823 RepID=UPI00261B1EED|nr:TonB-dependent receptor [Henriciella sp.]
MAKWSAGLFTGVAFVALAAAPSIAQTESAAVQSFDLPSGPLSEALDAFIAQSGRDLIYRSDQVQSVLVPSVQGDLSDREALDRLLEGSSLMMRADESGAILVYAQAEEAKPAPRAPAPAPRQVEPPSQPTVQPAAPQTDEEARLESVVVVGTQIRGAQVGGELPVAVVGDEQLAAIGAVDGDDVFRSIPQFGDVGFNSTENVSGGVNSARGDVASINLRALGTGNTLVLLNGRRMVNHPGTQSENLVPVTTVNANAIPVTGISRLEVLLDGASALYGSDAVAGVVNTVLKDDFDGLTVSARYGTEPDVEADEYNFTLEAGKNFNDGRSNVALFAAYTDRDPVFASERDFAANADLRDRLPENWAGDLNFRNNSNNTPWGAFTLRDPATGDTIALDGVSSSGGGVHVQPDTFDGCVAGLADGLCLDDGNSASNVAQRYNTNSDRTINNGVERLNLFSTFNHDFDNGLGLFAEAGLYTATSNAQRAGSAQLSAARMLIPADNYYNPFGPAGAPNRVEGIGTPEDGLDVELRRYRLVDAGAREIEVENTNWRLLGGLEGNWSGFDWETALLYSEAETTDTTSRTSNTLFLEALSKDTPDAYNPFNGGGFPISDSGDGTPSNAATIDNFIVPVFRKSSTSLSLWDLKVSRPDLLEIWAGPVGAAFGVEARRETYEDDRDPRLDGTVEFVSPITGEATSDVMGSSPTLDSEGERDVFSAFAELAVPLISPEMNVPLAQSVNMQLAVRYEDYDLFGSVTKPKVALSWRPSDSLLFRSAWSQGFKAPNLQQQFDRSLERVNNRTDFIQCEADLRAGRISSFSDCEQTAAIVSQREGSTDLGPEESESFSAGLVYDATFLPEEAGALQVTLDYWSIEQEDVVGIFGDENHLILDYLLRTRGSSNPAVVRADPTAEDIAAYEGTGLDPAGEVLFVEDNYLNLLPRDVEGLDLGVYYDLETRAWGDFGLKVNVAQLRKFYQDIAPREAAILDAQESGEISDVVALEGAGDLIRQDGRPEWRWSASATWRMDAWGAGWYTSYVDDVFDTSATNDDTGDFWVVDSAIRHNAYVQYTFGHDTDKPLQLRVGARNVFDEEPPLADESFGYLGGLHSSRGRFLYVNARKSF